MSPPEALPALQGASDVIDHDYGGLPGYLAGPMGMKASKIKQLRHHLLERHARQHLGRI